VWKNFFAHVSIIVPLRKVLGKIGVSVSHCTILNQGLMKAGIFDAESSQNVEVHRAKRKDLDLGSEGCRFES
jgi:hypothetical protein